MERINRDLTTRKIASQMLNVQDNASAEQLKHAYRKAAIAHHPDHNGTTNEANRRFAMINCAYELLAFDEPCDALLADRDSRSDVPEDNKYRLNNPWGHFCWWREKFLGTDKRRQSDDNTSCI
jgi:DnaJ domain